MCNLLLIVKLSLKFQLNKIIYQFFISLKKIDYISYLLVICIKLLLTIIHLKYKL